MALFLPVAWTPEIMAYLSTQNSQMPDTKEHNICINNKISFEAKNNCSFSLLQQKLCVL